MKTRESGMPPEEMWEGFFHPETILRKLGLTERCGDVLEFGCGYGTFTIPTALMVRGTVYALDIDPEMIAASQAKVEAAGLTNVKVRQRDFVADGTGLADGSVDFVMLFNILHADERLAMLREAWRVTAADGKLAVIHWNYDSSTPRGPSMSIRPRPEDCRSWAEQVGYRLMPPGMVDLPPCHYGFIFERPT